VGEDRGQPDEAGFRVDRGGLDDCDLVAAEAFAHDLEAARQRSIAKRPVALARERRADRAE
jgi:hypothetical protein